MVIIRWRIVTLPRYIHAAWKRQTQRMAVCRNSLFYNHFTNRGYVLDVLMEPIFWFVDNFTKVLGPFFVLCVCLLTASVVCIAYWIGLPYWWEKSPLATVFLLIFGHWLLLNVSFHYYMAATTSPGAPPEGILIPEAASMCRKCIAPKPPRTHHCSVCNRCVLKMDHHCPWLDNCIGHHNHRYFFLYSAYTVVGVAFIIAFGVEIAYAEVWAPSEADEELVGHSVTFNNSVMVLRDDGPPPVEVSNARRRCIIYMAFICSGVLVALGSLTAWHARLIGRGETSVETIINKAETKRLAACNKLYTNPYDFGARRNWRTFLGMAQGRGWRHVLLPSAHAAHGDGLTFDTTVGERERELAPPVFERVQRRHQNPLYASS